MLCSLWPHRVRVRVGVGVGVRVRVRVRVRSNLFRVRVSSNRAGSHKALPLQQRPGPVR